MQHFKSNLGRFISFLKSNMKSTDQRGAVVFCFAVTGFGVCFVKPGPRKEKIPFPIGRNSSGLIIYCSLPPLLCNASTTEFKTKDSKTFHA